MDINKRDDMIMVLCIIGAFVLLFLASCIPKCWHCYRRWKASQQQGAQPQAVPPAQPVPPQGPQAAQPQIPPPVEPAPTGDEPLQAPPAPHGDEAQAPPAPHEDDAQAPHGDEPPAPPGDEAQAQPAPHGGEAPQVANPPGGGNNEQLCVGESCAWNPNMRRR